ncbi:MAG: transporter [Desulfobulbus sp.]|jgi:hypothetical protein|uniref:transporter n=1 Tax=Desulfobulbus sp. TaxID=895 RepID=UPI002850275C|nr:transporter [Desulfobulbus sp.]MDR2550251.1 transporter [Desulfobulbus sp.]
MPRHASHSSKLALCCLLGSALLPAGATAAPTAAIPGPENTVAVETFSNEHAKLNTADASPLDPGHYELEPSFAYTHSERSWDGGGHAHGRGLFREQRLALSFLAGLVEDVDLNIKGGYSWLKDNDNDFDPNDGMAGPSRGADFTDLDIKGRYRFYNNPQRHLAFAYIAGVTIPTGSDSDRDDIGTSQEYWSFNQTLALTKDWGRWTANGDIGYALPIGNKRANARGTLVTDLAVGYQVFHWLQPEVELNYSHDYLEGEDDAQTLAVTAGLLMPYNATWRVNIGVQQGIWGENADKATKVLTAVKFAF